ncbi:MAG: hypothetical protein JSW28_07730 [Thermoplasmata archaeon]|nr:MAG: hypothetical protein JSW28_07730 [Thermoplasmata archaeon]
MIPVAESQGITIHAPPKGIVGFNTSPYPVHVQGGAVDLFPGSDFSIPVKSPVFGKVTFIEKNKVGIARHFNADPNDYIMAIEQKKTCVRMLHVKPKIGVGEAVEVGDELGTYLRSPLLPFWSYPHIHAEVKDCRDVQSPLNAHPLNLLGSGEFKGAPKTDYVGFEAEVLRASENYLIVLPDMDIFGNIGNYWGVALGVGEEFALLDAQAPWNCYGGLLLPKDSDVREGQEVLFGAVSLGVVVKRKGNYATYAFGGELGDGIDRYSKGLLYKDVGRFNVPYKRIKVNDDIFLGISTSLSLYENRTLKLVPAQPLERSYEEGEKVSIELDIGNGD